MVTTIYTDANGSIVMDYKGDVFIQYNGDGDIFNSLRDNVMLAVAVILFSDDDTQVVGDNGLTKLLDVQHNDIDNANLFKMIVDKVIATL